MTAKDSVYKLTTPKSAGKFLWGNAQIDRPTFSVGLKANDIFNGKTFIDKNNPIWGRTVIIHGRGLQFKPIFFVFKLRTNRNFQNSRWSHADQEERTRRRRR